MPVSRPRCTQLDVYGNGKLWVFAIGGPPLDPTLYGTHREQWIRMSNGTGNGSYDGTIPPRANNSVFSDSDKYKHITGAIVPVLLPFLHPSF